MMLPIVDYGGIALVVPKISAVGRVVQDQDNYGFEVFCEGLAKPLMVVFQDMKEAEKCRDELIAIIARYYYLREFGPDFDADYLDDMLGDDEVDENDDGGEKH